MALFYGAYRIVAGKYDGGQVVLVQIATLMASFALGQAAPNLQHFGAGRAAGARMFKIIERQPLMHDVGAPALPAPSGKADAPPEGGKELAVVDASSQQQALVVVLPAHNGTGELDKVAGHLELRDVFFNYPARPDVPVFRCVPLCARMCSRTPAAQACSLPGGALPDAWLPRHFGTCTQGLLAGRAGGTHGGAGGRQRQRQVDGGAAD